MKYLTENVDWSDRSHRQGQIGCQFLLTPVVGFDSIEHPSKISFYGGKSNSTGATVEPYGSFVSNLFTRWGDLDISIELPNGSFISSVGKKHKQTLLEDVRKALRSRAIFPRINVRDPYKQLGISREASKDEIQAVRNFLLQKYGGHKLSVDAIESAHDGALTRRYLDKFCMV